PTRLAVPTDVGCKRCRRCCRYGPRSVCCVLDSPADIAPDDPVPAGCQPAVRRCRRGTIPPPGSVPVRARFAWAADRPALAAPPPEPSWRPPLPGVLARALARELPVGFLPVVVRRFGWTVPALRGGLAPG